MVEAEDGEVGTKDSMPRGTRAFNQNGSPILNKILMDHRFFDSLSYMQLFPDSRDGLYQRMVMKCGTNGICIVGDGEANLI